MRSAISAEFAKFTRHRATWGLVWIWPIGVIVIWAIAILIALATGRPPVSETMARVPQPGAGQWIAGSAAFWNAPPSAFGRYLIGSFVAVVFGGEYGWNTWKLIVPHRARASLIGAKYVTAFLLLFAAFILGALLFMLLGWLRSTVIMGVPVPDGVTVGALVWAQAAGALATVGPVLVTAGMVSLFAILTRSTVAALIIGLVLTTVESIFMSILPLLDAQAPTLTYGLTMALPGYHLANISHCLTTNEALVLPFDAGPFSTSLAVSMIVAELWVALLVGLTFWRFGRQDLN